MMPNNLEKANIKKRSAKGCGCQDTALVYTLPFGLGEEALQYLQVMGLPSVSFEKTSLLKIENADFGITGIKRLKDVRFALKNSQRADLIATFEENLVKYVESQNERQCE